MPVRLLASDTIGKIAAGEVVERPASVAKELLENALDAGASHIEVEIADGGLELIQVRDDGGGMAREELSLAVRRHTTSKLTTFEDLDRLTTLGFRGEALPSIAAVSRFSLRTRRPVDSAGWSLTSDFGVFSEPRLVAAPAGTLVAVSDLFGNVPARRKFLRQAATESAYIVRTVAAYATAYPSVAMSVTVDRRRSFSTDGAGDLRAAAVAVHGAEVGQSVLALAPLDPSAVVPGVSVDGWIGAPAVTRSHRQGLLFFVNGRWIQNRALSFALEDAYHSLLMVGRHPVALVRISVDPAAVDVNVHPTKAEVKFLDERLICRAVQRAAHAALTGAPHDDLPRLRFEAVPTPPVSSLPISMSTPFESRIRTAPSEEAARQSESVGHPSGVPILRVLGQVGGAFIIAEGPEGMYLIDQHAAHERVLYEKILARLRSRASDQQPLLDPLVIDLSPEELAVFDRSRDELAQLGFEIDIFAEGAIAVRAVPSLMRTVDITERFRAILKELGEGGVGASWLDAVAITTACHTSIRAGQSLSLSEMRELVAELERSSQPRSCGHGRPTMLLLSQTDLERQFARR